MYFIDLLFPPKKNNMGAIFSVRAKYQAFHKKEKTSSHGIYVIEVATTPSFRLETADVAKTRIPQSSMEYGLQPL